MKTAQQCLRLLIIALIGWTIKSSLAEIRVVCYYTNWSVYRPGTAKFNPQNINPYLCTHLIYAFGGFTKESNFKPFDKYQDIEKGGYAKFTGLKTYNKNLKTMLAIGGWNEGSSRFSPMVANAEKRREFVKNSIKFLRQNHFDGLDLDWEYPAFRDGGKSRDRDNYASLVQELREEYERESEKTGRPRLLLTMAVPAGIEYINKGYDVPKLMKYLDWMNILSYDYHSAFEPAVNHHSPLYGLEEESEYNYDSDLNINHTISHYLEAGAISEKLVLGIPTYGRSYTLFNPDATDIGSPADGPGEMGDATRENGYLAYYEICEKIKDSDDWFVEQPNPNAMGPYAYKDNQWVGYDDENIVRKKSEFVAKNKLGGIMFWSIDNDDFRGTCTGKPYPLIEAAKEALMAASGYIVDNVIPAPDKAVKTDSKRKRKRPTGAPKKDESESTERLNNKSRIKINKKKESDDQATESPAKTRREKIRNDSRRRSTVTSSTTTTTSSSGNRYTTPEPPTTPDAGTDFKCEDEGFFPHPRDCKKYYWCLSSGPSELGIIAHQFTCPSGLYFNKAADSCDYTQNVLCNKKKATPKTTSTTTTEIPSTTEAVTSPVSVSLSTRRPQPRSTSTTSRTTFAQSSTAEYEDEYEYEDEVNKEKDDSENSEEDPRVIKELLDLIRKAGGIEELEKQLNHYETNSTSVTSAGSTTPSSFSKSLYQRVLSRTVGKSKDTSSRTNNSGGPQFKGSQDSSSKSRRTKPQYTAISRQRQTSRQQAAVIDESKNDDYEEDEEEEEEQQQTTSKSHFVPEYKTIIRSRTTTTTELSTNGNDVTQPLRIEDENKQVEKQVVTSKTPEYVTLSRRRPTTTSTTVGDFTTSKYLEIRGRSSTTEEISTATPEVVTKELKNEDINVTVSFRSIPGEEASTTETNVTTRKDEKDNALVKSDSQTVYIASTTESTKVSDNFSSKSPSRSRFYSKITRPTVNTESTIEHDRTTSRSKSKFSLPQEKSSQVENQNKVAHDGNEQAPTERSRSRFTLHEMANQKAKDDNEQVVSTESTRRRGTMRFGQQVNSAQSGGLRYDDGSYHPDLYQERKFRPDIAIEISDLSSLTSADLSIKDGSRARTHSRRVLPKQQTNESAENSQQVRAKEIIKSVQVEEIKTTTASSLKERTLNLPKIQKPNSLFNRRLRPNLAVNETKVANVNSGNVRENGITPETTENTTVKRRLIKRVKPTPRSTASPTTTASTSIPTTASTSTTVTISPPTSTTSSSSEPTRLSTTLSTSSPTTARLENINNNSITVNNANVSVEYEDDIYKTSEEEEENIKLSESNIREASEVNSFGDKPRRRIVKKIIEGKSAQTKFNALENLKPSTAESPPTLGRRTIVKKLQTATEDIPINSTQAGRRTVLKRLPAVTTETVPTTRATKNGRTRKIIRRLKVPASTDRTTSAELLASSENGLEDEVELTNETTVRDEEEATTELNVDLTTDSDIFTTIFEDAETTPLQTTTVTTAKSTTSVYYKSKFSRPPFLKQRSRPTTEASTRVISTRNSSKNSALSRFNTRRKSILVSKDAKNKVVLSTTESAQNVTESDVISVTIATVAANTSVTELTTDMVPESTTPIDDVVPTTQIDLEVTTDVSAEIEPFDEIKFVTDSILEKELANLIKLYEAQRLASSSTENTMTIENSTLTDNATAIDNSTQIINSTLANIASEIQNSTATDNSTQTQNATKTKLKPNPLLKTPLQRPKFVPKIKTIERNATKPALESERSVKSQIESSNGSFADGLIYEADGNETEAHGENINGNQTVVVNGTEINQEPRSLTNHPLFAHRFVTTQKQENETELSNITETNKIRSLAEILEIEKSNAGIKNGTRVDKFKKILENEAFKTSTTRRPSFKPKNGKRPQNRLNNSTGINKYTSATFQDTKDSEQDEVSDSSKSEEERETEGEEESGGEATQKLALNKRPTFIPKLKPLTSSRESAEEEDSDKTTQSFLPKLPTINHNFKPLPPLSDQEASKENEEATIRQKFVPKRPTFKPFDRLTPNRDDVDEELKNELATENQSDFETETEITDSDDGSFDGENQENENYDDTASREGLQRPKFVPRSKFLKNKPQEKTTNRFVPPSFGANRKNVSKKVNNPELQLQTLVQTGNARNALFHKTRKANTPFVGIARSSTTASTTEQIVTTEEIVDATTITYEEERITEEEGRTEDIRDANSKQMHREEVEAAEKRQKQMQEDVEQKQAQVSETTSEKQPEITEQSFTLQHIFAEAPTSTPLTTTEKETSVEFSTRDAKKLERLIEVNRIVEVSLKEGKFKHNLMVENEVTLGPILDRIGEINRVTVIKVVDPNGDLKLILQQNDTSNESAKIEKAEIIEPLGKLTRYGEKLEAYLLPAKSQDLEDLKSKIEIYGKSIVNKYTPVTTKPPFSAEFSTIALEGLFKPFTTADPSREDKDEILETQNANYVNIRVLKDESDHRGTVSSKPSDVESRARVVEITPEVNSKIIKIAPIAISFSSSHTVNES